VRQQADQAGDQQRDPRRVPALAEPGEQQSGAGEQDEVQRHGAHERDAELARRDRVQDTEAGAEQVGRDRRQPQQRRCLDVPGFAARHVLESRRRIGAGQYRRHPSRGGATPT
jgi:hypothetical protein